MQALVLLEPVSKMETKNPDSAALAHYLNTNYGGNVSNTIKTLHPELNKKQAHNLGEKLRRKLNKKKSFTLADWETIYIILNVSKEEILQLFEYQSRYRKKNADNYNTDLQNIENSKHFGVKNQKNKSKDGKLVSLLKNQVHDLRQLLVARQSEIYRLLKLLEQKDETINHLIKALKSTNDEGKSS